MSAGYLPFTVQEIEIICNETVFRPVWEYGVELNGGQKYNSPDLAGLRRRIGVHENGKSKAEVKIKSIKFDIGYIWVLDTFEKIWLKIPNTSPEYASGLTLYQHKIIQKFAKKMYKESEDYQILIEAKERMREYVASLAASVKMADRTKAAKTNGKTSRQSASKNGHKDHAGEDYVFGEIFQTSASEKSKETFFQNENEGTQDDQDEEYDSVPNFKYAGGK